MYMHPHQEHIVSAWKKEATNGHPTICGYDFKEDEKTLHLYTDRPGCFIGRGGKLFEKYETRLKASFQSCGEEFEHVRLHEVVKIK